MTLRRKILSGYGVSLLLLTLALAWGLVHLVSLGRAADAILKENYRSILAAENMVNTLERQDSAVLLLFLGDETVGARQFHQNEAGFLEWLTRAKDNITIPGEAALLDSIETEFSDYRLELQNLFSGGPPSTSSTRMYHDGLHPRFARIRDACQRLRRMNEVTMYVASERARRLAHTATWSTGVVAGSTLCLALAFSVLLSDRIVRPVQRIMEASRRIASGHYDVRVEVASGDELGQLAAEFNDMAGELARYDAMNIETILAEKQKGEAILSSIDDGLIVLGTDQTITGINPAARKMLGVEASAAVATERLVDLVPDAGIEEMVRQTVQTGRPPAVDEADRMIMIGSGKRARHFLFSVTAIPGKEQQLSGAVLLLRDVTRLKEVEQLKSEFVMAASHELRTPLTSMGMSIKLLREHASDKLPERDRELLEAAHEEVQRLRTLIDDLLDLSKIESGHIALEFDRVPVEGLVDHVLAVFQSQFQMKPARVSLHLDPDLPSVRADATKITWVLTNLISNALRYLGSDGHMEIHGRAAGGFVYLAVKDDGPGIPPEYHSRIFQKFVRVDRWDTTGGSGLGLAICKEIVRAHGGSIWVESAPGKGSTFTFTVPVA